MRPRWSWFLGTSLALGALVGLSARADRFDVAGRVLVDGKPAEHVVVWIDAPQASREPQTVVMDQRNLTFEPGLLVTSVGSTVVFPNNDRVLHNVFSFRDGKQFDLGVYPVGRVKQVRFTQPGVSRLFCNIHPRMVAYVVVVDSPYYAASGRDGTFVLRAVPPGTYTYRAWRAEGGEVSNALTVTSGARLEIQWPSR